MKLIRNLTGKFFACAALAGGAAGALAQSMTDYTALPPFATANATNPMVLLTMSADHQFFIEAYNDFEDYNEDGAPDGGYAPDFSYAGYFDPATCYTYNASAAPARFVPNSPAVAGAVGPECPGALWSGNFLNWVSMTRMDLVRHVLYGGFRRVDSATETVLERAFLPHDGHSFAKYVPFNDTEMGKWIDASLVTSTSAGGIPVCPGGNTAACTGFTFCSTSKPGTPGDGIFTQAYNLLAHPPQLRIVRGNYEFWASSERFQCLYGPLVEAPGDASGGEILDLDTTTEPNVPDPGTNSVGDPTASSAFESSPLRSQGIDFEVRVQVCTGVDYQYPGADVCRQYPEAVKPAGILQQFTEDDGVKFGLMTGGFSFNKSWGVLRRNVGLINDEIDPQTGSFNHTAGVAAGADQELIISSLDALRVVDYQYQSGNNDFKGTYNASGCRWGLASFNNGQCRNWGNPFSELLAESYRYFAGASEASVTEPANLLPGLTVARWRDPVVADDRGACANMNVIGFNASTSSYDNDDLALGTTMNSLGFNSPSDGQRTLSQLMSEVDSVELQTGKRYFVGSNGGAVDANFCTPKSIASLANATGICPEAPGLDGSFLGAGLAYFAYNYPVRPMTGPNRVERPYIRTAGVTLSGTLPSISFTDEATGQRIDILPACRNSSLGGNCALVDFKLLTSGTGGGTPAAGTIVEKYFVGWEDSEQGGDFDVDMNGLIIVTRSPGSVTVATDTTYSSTTDSMGFGFIISGTGTDNDGLYMRSGVNNFSINLNGDATRGCTACNQAAGQAAVQFSINPDNAGTVAEFLETPLFYATKWGSFDKRGGDRPPASGPNGTPYKPDNYISVKNLSQLKSGLTKQIDNLFKREAAGTGAAVSGGSLTGDGMIIQGLYLPSVNGANGSQVTWAGVVNALFVDDQGRSREDTDRNGVLSAVDRVVRLNYDRDSDNTVIDLYVVDENGSTPDEPATRNVAIERLRPLWSAVDELAAIDDPTDQRSYTSNLRGRHILTGAEPTADGTARVVQATRPFTADQAADLAPKLDFGNGDSANLINFIRGQEIEGFRSRSLDTDGDGEPDQKWLLGDLVNSTPAVVKRPIGDYASRYSDRTYYAYQQRYLNRRQVVYAGTNDGMLHAFNAGFYNFADNRYQTTDPTSEDATGGLPLGAELWAYVPYNLLPHLKWLADPEYTHVFYMDSDIQTFDVNIFGTADPDTYPGGWGTILVAGMRFGGGPYTIGEGDSAETFRSAFVIMDITDPERAPRLLAEFTDEDLGFTVGNVEVLRQRFPGPLGYGDPDATNDWHLVFGSGPQGNDAFTAGNSNNSPYIYALNLVELAKGDLEWQKEQVTIDNQPVINAYVGGITSADWNRDFRDDALYFGLIGNDQPQAEGDDPFRGALMQARHRPTGSPIGTISQLLTGRQGNAPFMAPPLAIPDLAGNHWLYAGTGRFMVKNDLLREDENYYFGLRVNPDSQGNLPNIAVADLIDVNDYTLTLEDGALTVTDASGEERTLSYVDGEVAKVKGWVRPLQENEAIYLPTVYSNETLWVATYLPPLESCSAQGTGNTYALDMFNGLAQTRLNMFVNSEMPKQVTQQGFLDTGVIFTSGEPIVGISSVGSGSKERIVITGLSGETTSLDPSVAPPPFRRRSWQEITLDLIQDLIR